MESIRRMRSLGAVLTLWIGGSLAPAGANDVQPAISHQAATDIAVKLVQQVTHGHLFSIAALHFEPSTREWFVNIDAPVDMNATKRFVARLNESTGLTCLQLPPEVDCIVQSNIQKQVADAQAKAEAEAIAREHPAPDLQQLANVLIRYQFHAEQSADNTAARSRYFVSLPSPDAKGTIDLSPDVVASLKRDSIVTYPGSAWKQDGANGPLDTRLTVGLPIRRSDGNYDVPYSFYCGPLCASWFTAVVRRDDAGWHIISSVMNAVS